MAKTTTFKAWFVWLLLIVGLMSGLGYLLFADVEKNNLLIGQATHGHHQIELACDACHVDSFGGPEVLQEACMNCHGDELELSDDSHPRKKFTNPRNAELAKKLDAKECITCHTEHQLEQTNHMGVSVPNDVCYHCHKDVGDNRESHAGLEFDTCATSGCHNFHDNRSLYEDFLVKNSGRPWVNYEARLLQANNTQYKAERGLAESMAHPKMQAHPDITAQWSESGHATAMIGCASCHEGDGAAWTERPEIEVCASCHESEVNGFVSGKHGMRLSAKLPVELSPMQPSMARIDMHASASDENLSCGSCHNVHKPDLQVAAAESCLTCHSDQHSMAYEGSPHHRLWQAEVDGHGDKNSGVSCATCHMPSEQHRRVVDAKTRTKEISVQHNQNATLRPNEKMIRPVCLQCHSLEFSIDALADEALILNNFNGKPSKHIESVDWALKRVRK